MTPSSPNIRCSDHSTREREGAPSQRLQEFRLSPQMTSSDLGVHGALAVHDFRFGLTLTIPRCAGPTHSWLLAASPNVPIRSRVPPWVRKQNPPPRAVFTTDSATPSSPYPLSFRPSPTFSFRHAHHACGPATSMSRPPFHERWVRRTLTPVYRNVHSPPRAR